MKPSLEPDRINTAPHPRQTVDLLGQKRAENDFLTAFRTRHLHHAWLISGRKGVGKATFAWHIARFLLAQNISNPPTGLRIRQDHPIAYRIVALSEPRLFYIRRSFNEKTKKFSKNITIDTIRKLKAFLQLSVIDGGWRVLIIDSTDDLSTQAANAMLKILEEPPPNVVLLLICHQPAIILPTIRSRCRVLRCVELDDITLKTALRQAGFNAGDNPQALNILANGSVGAAIQLLNYDGVKLYQQIVSILAQAPNMDRNPVIKISEDCAGVNKKEYYETTLDLFITCLARLARHGILYPHKPLEAAHGERAMMEKFATNTAAAQKWAIFRQTINRRIAHAHKVNLDPTSIIMDIFLKFNQTA